MNIGELSDRLAGNALAVCKMLYPNGRQEGNEYRLGGTDGSTGKSMAIHLSGDKAGVWSDFATGESGDLIDLWRIARGLDVKDALDQVRGFLGVQRPDFHTAKPKKEYKKPERPKDLKSSGPGRQLLNDRGISDETIKRARVAFRRNDILFPFFEPGEEKPSMIKFRDVDDKHKTGPTSAGQKPILLGWHTADPDARECLIVEGEIDYLSALELGVPAPFSTPFGGGKDGKQLQWIENEYDNLDRFDTIKLALDMDAEGELAVQTIINRLGAHRCVRVELPRKDFNECLQDGLKEWRRFPEKQYDPEELKRPSDYRDEIMRDLYPGEDYGIRLPWTKADGKLRWREAELIILNGINGHGKSQLLGHAMIDAMSYGQMGCVYSGELRPGRLLSRMVRQVNGERQIPDERRADLSVDWLDESLLVFDLTGTAKTTRLLEVFEYAYRRYGVKVFAIDSLMKCGIAVDDYNGQKKFVEALCDFKNKFNVIIFLVTHSRKVSDEREQSGKMDVKGDSSITDLADTVLSVWRNKPKEEEVEQARFDGFEPSDELRAKPDAIVQCLKQRNGDWEGGLGLFFDRHSLQYTDNHDDDLFIYLPLD